MIKNIINIGQDASEIVSCLLRRPVIMSALIVRHKSLIGHRDFHVKADKAFVALNFLKLNNPFFTDITTDNQRSY